MELKAKLIKPYTAQQRADFIIINNHRNGYNILEKNDCLEAWGPTEKEQKEQALENKKNSIRSIREQYFSDYVDWYQSKPLLWEEMSSEEKQDISDYRNYLKDYTKEENWWEHNPMTFEEWKNHD